ncbi:MAG: UvrD-helicase domain-containing protein [Clostridia bacterium]|nr:UvrD-helicase domain-containing protein [Clostridia bacterium]
MQNFIKSLNKEQLLPVLETEGPVLVIAGAGSGKTRVLTSRIAHLVHDLGVSPYNILAITFTNKAANEMKERLEKMVGEIDEMWVCTIHSMCVRILRSDADKIGYNKNFSIYSETDKDKVLKRIITSLALEFDKYHKNAKNYISEIKNKDLSVEEFKKNFAWLRDLNDYVRIYEEYEAELLRSNAFDFDDLLIKTYRLLSEQRDVLIKYAKRFHYVHVDEFQDTNVVQYNIVKMLCSFHCNVFVVGDDDQSIYGWRGADISNILDFDKDFKGAKVFKLQQNYRSTKRILSLANAVIAKNTLRRPKELWTENDDGVKPEVYIANEESEEAQYTAIAIKNLVERGYKFSDFAVLMRINALTRSYEQEFTKYGIPCKVYGGFKFFERKEIKDIMAYLRILCNPLDNEAVLRVINVPKRGIGDKSIDQLIHYADSNGYSVFDSVFDYEYLELNSGAKNKIKAFKELIATLIIDKENLSLTQLVDTVIKKTDFLSCFDDDSPESEDKKRNVDEFKSSVADFERLNPEASLSEYLNSVTLSSDTDDINESDCVTLATVHSVKGLEYPCVFVCGLDMDIFPLQRTMDKPDELEEERRLMYVAITRAKERLYLTRARSRFLYGSRRSTVQSEFLDDMSDALGLPKNRVYGYQNAFQTGNYGGYQGGYSNGYQRKPQEDRRSSFGYSGSEESSYAPSFGGVGRGAFASSFKNGTTYGNKNKPQKPEDKDMSKFRTGAKVLHKKFGEGIIVELRQNGDETVGMVAFKGVGVKALVLRLAPIEVIE